MNYELLENSNKKDNQPNMHEIKQLESGLRWPAMDGIPAERRL